MRSTSHLLRTHPAAWLLVAVLIGAAGCGQLTNRLGRDGQAAGAPSVEGRERVAVRLHSRPVSPAARPCTGRFRARDLPHTTSVGGGPILLYESNGAGLGVNDLDGDGDQDLVLANLAGPDTILWNEGELRFRKQPLGEGGSRAVTLVDVEGDGRLDIALSRHTLEPILWRNLGGGRFAEAALPGVEHKAYALDWGDLDGDGDLDLVTGSYDVGLEKDLGFAAMRSGSGTGAYLHRQHEGEFLGTRLADQANALAIALPGPQRNGLPAILVGNDFTTPDGMWDPAGADGGSGWKAVSPFANTTHSTMSLDTGDIDNDGTLELYATDMKPYAQDVGTHARWRPMMTKIPHETFRGDKQVMENVLQVRAGGGWRNAAYEREVDATGWSWSGKFGDLDADGLLDLLVVNGMIAPELFGHLANGELVEEHQAFRNTSASRFERAPGWSLGATRSGRGMSMADMDGDGDLDIVVNNLGTPAQLFENELCGGASFAVDLRQPGARNTRALGATLLLHTSAGTLRREVRAQGGYLSGDSARATFGFPKHATLDRLEVIWPDGRASVVREIRAGTVLEVTR